MKKVVLASLGIIISGAIVWAVGVGSIPTKGGGDAVTFTEINSLFDAVSGIFNTGTGVNHKFGINTETGNVSLKLKGAIAVTPITGSSKPTCNNSIEGAIFAESDGDKHLWGCNGTDWVQLDTNPPVCN